MKSPITLNVDKIYIQHHASNIARRKYIDSLLNKLTNKFEYCTWPMVEELTPELKSLYKRDIKNLVNRANAMGKHYFKQLEEKEIAAVIGMFTILQKAAIETKTCCLVLEDDITVNKHFSKFNEFLAETPADFDIIQFGDGCNFHHYPLVKSKHVYKREKGMHLTRCHDSTIYSKSCLDKIKDSFFPFSQPGDWEMEWKCFNLDLKVYWWEPTLVTQGSANGTYKSNLR